MAVLYLVRCNYADPVSLDDWNSWYNGPKQDWLLSRPGFQAGQRFQAASSTDGIRYAALYAIDSPAALDTPEYRSGWGWGEWRPGIVDWTRNFFDGVSPSQFLTKPQDRLRLIFVSSPADIAAARDAFDDVAWLPAVPGLDETLSAVGLGVSVGEDLSAEDLPEGVQLGSFAAVSPARYAPNGTFVQT